MTSVIPDQRRTSPTASVIAPRDPRFLAEEVGRLHRGAADRGSGRRFVLGVKWSPDATQVEYLYRQGQLLCRWRDLDDVMGAFDRIGAERPIRVSQTAHGLALLELGDRDAADLADALAEETSRNDLVTPNHVLDAQAHYLMCPATEAMPWSGPVSTLDEPSGQRSAQLAIIDTGHSTAVAEESEFARFSAIRNAEIDEQVYYPDSTDITPYGGHGAAATACALAVSGAEHVTVDVYNVLEGGAVDEVAMVDALTRALESGADVISMQAGCYTREGEAPLAFTTFAEEVLPKYPNAVIVTAAGNNSQDDPFYPAAFDWVTGVGGLTHDGERRADWSNHGDWVDVYASGENRVVPYPNGTYEYLTDTTAEFTEGHALWSGTSFATPVVAGMIARRMVIDDVDARTARDRVLADARADATDETGPRVRP